MSEWEPDRPPPKPLAVQTRYGSKWHIRRSPWSSMTACTVSIPYYQTDRRWPTAIDPKLRCNHAACKTIFDQCDLDDEASVPDA